MFQHFDLFAGQRLLEPVRKAHQEMFFAAGRRAGDNPHRAAGMHQRLVRPPNLDQRHDLGPGRDVVWLMRHVS